MSRTLTHPNDSRQAFLEFFASKNHLVYPSASLKSDDPGLLFNVAGMQQFKPYFQGATPVFPGVEGTWSRVATAQKCMRAGGKDSDIENIGRTRRHHTFFEMLGNFSFGDYFKEGAIEYAWELLTSKEWLGLEPEKLYITVYTDDDEAYDIWREKIGIPEAHLSRFGEDENFWPANAIKDERSGPCGPCSEIFYDRGPAYGTPDETGPNTGSGDRYMEIYNLVFTQYNLENGELTPLPQQNIDTGFGFERLVTVMTGAADAYATELFGPSIRKLVELTGKPYEDTKSLQHRIIADHIRSVTMALGDGILPANDGAGYVIKMLIRRAARQAYLLGVREPLLYKLVPGVVEAMGGYYQEIKDSQSRIEEIVRSEEEQFLRTLESGIVRVNKLLDELDGETVPGEVAFDLWETYGFPSDLTRDMAEERGLRVDEAGFQAAKEAAREVSRAGQGKGAMFASSNPAFGRVLQANGETEFLGYTDTAAEASVLALLRGDEEVSEVGEGDTLQVILDRTPFYAEGGGQVGDVGTLEWAGGAAEVLSTTKAQGLFVHQVQVTGGELKVGQKVQAVVDSSRTETQKHHSATHLLHAALRSVLGTHVAQAGSLVMPERLRFDFSHNRAVTGEEIEGLEQLVNRWIQADFAVDWEVMPIAQARKEGAMMLFGEKYGAEVRMVTIGSDTKTVDAQRVSAELCGGTHVARTGEIGSLLITSEEAVSAGVRRIEALTGNAALRYMQDLRSNVQAVAKSLGAKPDELGERVTKLQNDLKEAQRHADTLRDKLAAAQTSGGAATEVKEAAGYSYVTSVLEGLDASALRNAADTLLQKTKADIVLVASGPLLVSKVSKKAQERGAHAGNLIREVATRAGGGGGGRPDMAQAGVKDTGKLREALETVPEILQGF